ncbi:MAG TPA: phage holin family protein [Streptosporangiaceae bacterium]|nr:phage holin family protein [Streptosporangiaceae bacterium]
MKEQVQPPPQEMTVRELTVQLSDDLTRLVRDEISLAKTELFASARQAALGGGMLTGALVAGMTSWLALVAAAIAGIAAGLPVWAAALLVGVALGVGAAALTLLGTRRLARGTPPMQMTIDSVRGGLSELAGKVRARR